MQRVLEHCDVRPYTKALLEEVRAAPPQSVSPLRGCLVVQRVLEHCDVKPYTKALLEEVRAPPCPVFYPQGPAVWHLLHRFPMHAAGCPYRCLSSSVGPVSRDGLSWALAH